MIGIYIIGGWIVLQVVYLLTDILGLPEWIPVLALVMLLVGFPIVVATAFVQEGVIPKQTDPDDTADKSRRHKILTWKNTAIGGLFALVLLSTSVIGYFILREAPEPDLEPESAIKSIAVLPFHDMSPAKDQEYFCEGMAEELINSFTQVKGLRVAARTSSFRFKGEGLDISTIGEQLNVATVLEGSVRKAGNDLRITAQLINVADGFHIWSQTYNREFKNVFAIQDEISKAIAGALHIELMGEEGAPLVQTYTENIEAYNEYLLGRYHWNKRRGFSPGEQSKKDLMAAMKHFKVAISLDPNYALAYSGLADVNLVLPAYLYDIRIVDTLARAEEAAKKALAIDPNLAEAQTSMGFVRQNAYLDFTGAERYFRHAIKLDPKYAPARYRYSFLLMFTGRTEEAIAEGIKLLELEPFSLF